MIALPATWIHKKRWTDENAAPPTASAPAAPQHVSANARIHAEMIALGMEVPG
jgi:hypothetical protein